MSNYEDISWKIQSGNKIKRVDCDKYITNNRPAGTSLLKVDAATQGWNGESTWFVLAIKAMKSPYQIITASLALQITVKPGHSK